MPPPPPGASAGGVAFNVGDAVNYGWTAYWKNVGPMLGITVVIFAVQFILSALLDSTSSTVGQVLLQVIGALIGIILTMGLFRASLAVCEGGQPSLAMLGNTDGFFNYLIAGILFYLGFALGLVFLIVPGVIFALVFFYFGYAVVQQPDLGAFDALKRSADITRGYRWQLLGLCILLLLINIVGLLALCVGVLFTYGISAIAVAYSYKVLSGQAVSPP